jgi:hypothetical protein
MGIYVTASYAEYSQSVYVTFLAEFGEVPSVTFMLAAREEINDIYADLFDDVFYCSLNKVVAHWERESCDVVTKSTKIAKEGVLIRNGEDNDSIIRIVNGKDPR